MRGETHIPCWSWFWSGIETVCSTPKVSDQKPDSGNGSVMRLHYWPRAKASTAGRNLLQYPPGAGATRLQGFVIATKSYSNLETMAQLLFFTKLT